MAKNNVLNIVLTFSDHLQAAGQPIANLLAGVVINLVVAAGGTIHRHIWYCFMNNGIPAKTTKL